MKQVKWGMIVPEPTESPPKPVKRNQEPSGTAFRLRWHLKWRLGNDYLLLTSVGLIAFRASSTGGIAGQPSGQYVAIMQGDGNFVLYHGCDPTAVTVNNAYWASNTYQAQGQYFAILQNDGNLFLYHGSDPAHQGAAYWVSSPLTLTTLSGNNQRHPLGAVPEWTGGHAVAFAQFDPLQVQVKGANCTIVRQSERPLMVRGPSALSDVIEPPSHLRPLTNLLTVDLSAASQEKWEASKDRWEAC